MFWGTQNCAKDPEKHICMNSNTEWKKCRVMEHLEDIVLLKIIQLKC